MHIIYYSENENDIVKILSQYTYIDTYIIYRYYVHIYYLLYKILILYILYNMYIHNNISMYVEKAYTECLMMLTVMVIEQLSLISNQ